jgi:uncharacterized repeat protein (TIGR03837 family)
MALPAPDSATADTAPLRWDVFCRVVDNHGDLGVCWRLAADLASRGHTVRLWVDDARALAFMAPGALEGRHPGVTVLPWTTPIAPPVLASLAPSDVWIEAFGCEIAPEFIANFVHPTWTNGQFCSKASSNPTPKSQDHPLNPPPSQPPAWINLEYLSAEPYVERSHGLPSPVLSGPGQGLTKRFFYPGFTPATGGLLREPDLAARQAAFDRTAWLAALGITRHGETLVSLFCYEPPALTEWLAQLARAPHPTRLLVTHGRATQAVKAIQSNVSSQIGHKSPSNNDSLLLFSYLPALTQRDFDHLLWACDVNLVRGEDSWVRALLAGKPMVWQAYPQADGAHHAKLAAWLDWLGAGPLQRRFHAVWNGVEDGPLPVPDHTEWAETAQNARARLWAQDDLTTQLVQFAIKNR